MRAQVFLVLLFVTATIAWVEIKHRPRADSAFSFTESDLLRSLTSANSWKSIYALDQSTHQIPAERPTTVSVADAAKAAKAKIAKAARNARSKFADAESDFAWIPAAAFVGKALAGGALSAAGKHAYDKFIRRRDVTESDFPIVPVAIGAWKLYNALKKDDSEESDFSIRGAISKAKEYYPKAKAIYGEGKNIYNSVQNIRKIIKDNVESDWSVSGNICVKTKYGKVCYNKDSIESDSEFLGKLISKVKSVAGKVKGVVEKGKAAYANGKNILDSAKNIIGLFKKSKQDSTESDFLGALKLGMTAFKAIKALKKNKKPKQQVQPEADMFKDIIAKLKEHINDKIAKLKEKIKAKFQEKKAAKKKEKKSVEESDAGYVSSKPYGPADWVRDYLIAQTRGKPVKKD